MSADGITTRASSFAFPETVERLTEAISQRGLTLFAIIDHGGAARQVGLHLRETKVVIFGSPAGGTPAMAATPRLALELPLKILVWQDEDTVRISYTTPASLAARFGLDAELAAPLAGIEAIADTVARPR